MKDTKSAILSNSKTAKTAFEGFVLTALEDEYSARCYRNLTVRNDNGKNEKLPDGFYAFFDRQSQSDLPLFLKVLYTTNYDYAERLAQADSKQISRVFGESDCLFICFAETPKCSNSLGIEGLDYVRGLAKKHPAAWWAFGAAIANNSELDIDRKENLATYKTVKDFLNIPFVLDLKEIQKLSDINERLFRILCSVVGKKPALILGNGISIPFGSDPWDKMATSIFDYLSPLYMDDAAAVKRAIGGSNYAVSSLVQATLSKEAYASAIYTCIYRKYEPSKMHSNDTLLRAAVEAKRTHPDMPVLTYNYDCFFEEDYKIVGRGRSLNSVRDEKSDMAFGEPKICHVHGLLPLRKPKRTKVVLSDLDYFHAYSTGRWTIDKQKRTLKNYVSLFVGSSMSDVYQLSTIQEAKRETEKQRQGFFCFSLLCLKDLSYKDKLSVITYFAQKGIRVIFRDRFEELAPALRRLFK